MAKIQSNAVYAPNAKVVFAYHSMERLEERGFHISRIAIAKELRDPNNWLMNRVDQQSGGNKGDGVKLIITLKVDDVRLNVVAIKKVEENRPAYIITTVQEYKNINY